jgi:hypothetical protein
MNNQTKNVFISHVHEDDAGLSQLKDLLESKGFDIRDGSINSDKPNEANDPNYIKSAILAPRIQWASVMIVYISPKTCESPWVEWEIEYAQKCDKRIVGVWAHGENNCKIPDALDTYADAVVGWNGDRIIDAITGKINDWQTQTGEPRPPREINRYSCS